MNTEAAVEESHDAPAPPDLKAEHRRYLETRALSGLAGPLAEKRAWRSERLWSWWRYRVGEDRANSFHEAAHAIVNEIRGRYTHFISLVAIRSGAYIIGGYTTTSATPDAVLPAPPSSSLPSDRENVARACVELGSGWRGGLRELRRLRKQAETMVAENWPLIRLVAQYLSQRRTLNREEFLSILEAHQSQQFIEIAAHAGVPNHA